MGPRTAVTAWMPVAALLVGGLGLSSHGVEVERDYRQPIRTARPTSATHKVSGSDGACDQPRCPARAPMTGERRSRPGTGRRRRPALPGAAHVIGRAVAPKEERWGMRRVVQHRVLLCGSKLVNFGSTRIRPTPMYPSRREQSCRQNTRPRDGPVAIAS